MRALVIGISGKSKARFPDRIAIQFADYLTGYKENWMIWAAPKPIVGAVRSWLLSMSQQAEYIVFEHGPFDYQTQNCIVEQKIEEAMKNFDYNASGYCLDTTQGRVFYFYHDCERFWKYVRPVKRTVSQVNKQPPA